MDIVQWIGFFISVMALLFLMTRGGKQSDHRQSNSEEHAHDRRSKEKQLKKMLKSLDIDVEDDEEERFQAAKFKQKAPILLAVPVIKPPMPHAPMLLENVPPAKRQAQRAMAAIHRGEPSKGKKLLGRLHSPKEMMILRELIGPPKSSKPIISHDYWG